MSNDILTQPIKKVIIKMTAPAAVGILMTFMFQLVDTYFIGKLGTTELAAASFAYPIYFLVVSLFMGLSAGVSSTIGKALGEQNFKKAKMLTTVSQIVFILLTVIIGAVGYYTITPVFSALGASSEMIALVAQYMEVIYIGMFFLVGTLIGNASLMAKGVMVQSTVIMGIGGLVNLILDYILIFGMGDIPAMGLQGAGLATVLSWVVTLVLMNLLLVKEKLVSFSFGSFAYVKAGLGEVFTVGGPAVAAQVLNPIAIAVITRVVSGYGDTAVAAFGIASRIESLGLTGVMSLSVVMTPMVAQNFGAKIQSRLDEIVMYSGKITVYWSVVLYTVLLLFTGAISSIFTDQVEVVDHIQYYFYIIGATFPFFGLTLITTSFFNGVYRPQDSLKLTLVKSLGLTIPLVIIGSFVSLSGVWAGIALANIVGMIYSNKLLTKWLKENNSALLKKAAIKDYINDGKYLLSKVVGR